MQQRRQRPRVTNFERSTLLVPRKDPIVIATASNEVRSKRSRQSRESFVVQAIFCVSSRFGVEVDRRERDIAIEKRGIHLSERVRVVEIVRAAPTLRDDIDMRRKFTGAHATAKFRVDLELPG